MANNNLKQNEMLESIYKTLNENGYKYKFTSADNNKDGFNNIIEFIEK